jgi:hypothetical protein
MPFSLAVALRKRQRHASGLHARTDPRRGAPTPRPVRHGRGDEHMYAIYPEERGVVDARDAARRADLRAGGIPAREGRTENPVSDGDLLESSRSCLRPTSGGVRERSVEPLRGVSAVDSATYGDILGCFAAHAAKGGSAHDEDEKHRDLARTIRSKNAGSFMITLESSSRTAASTKRSRNGRRHATGVADAYGRPPNASRTSCSSTGHGDQGEYPSPDPERRPRRDGRVRCQHTRRSLRSKFPGTTRRRGREWRCTPRPAPLSLTERLARFSASLTFDSLPEAVAHQAYRCLLDTTGRDDRRKPVSRRPDRRGGRLAAGLDERGDAAVPEARSPGRR